MSPVFPVFHTITTVSWSQKRQIEDHDPYPLTHRGQTRHARGPAQLPHL